MKIHPYVVLGKTHRSELEGSLRVDLDAWASVWFSGDVSLSLKVSGARESFAPFRAMPTIKVNLGSGDQWVICPSDNTIIHQLSSLLLGGQNIHPERLHSDSLMNAVARQALRDLFRRFFPSETVSNFKFSDEKTLETSLPNDALMPGREAICVSFKLREITIPIWVPVSSLLARIGFPPNVGSSGSERIVKPRQAVANQKLTGWVTLGRAELTVGALASLKAGDVIRMDKDLQEPLALVFENFSAGFSGYLGRQDDLLAFRIQELLDM